jgi:hypothetical protein
MAPYKLPTRSIRDGGHLPAAALCASPTHAAHRQTQRSATASVPEQSAKFHRWTGAAGMGGQQFRQRRPQGRPLTAAKGRPDRLPFGTGTKDWRVITTNVWSHMYGSLANRVQVSGVASVIRCGSPISFENSKRIRSLGLHAR